MQIQKRIQIRYGRQIVGVGIQKTLCVGRNAENLMESKCFYLKVSRVNVFSSNFSQVCMFCDDGSFEVSTRVYATRGFSQLKDCQ